MPDRRQVLVLNQFALPLSHGGGTRHVELFGKLENWDATILAANKHYFDQRLVESDGILRTVPVTRFSGNGFGRVINWASYSVSALAWGLARRRVSVVYGSSPHLGAALAGWMIARITRRPFVLEVRDLWPQILAETGMLRESSRTYRGLKMLERFLYRAADRIVVLAEGSATAIEAEGIHASQIVFVPNGADPSDFEVATDREELRQRFGFEAFTIVYTGAHGPANGLDLALDAAAAVTDFDVVVVLVGDGVSKVGLVADAERRGLKNVRFMDPITKSEIPELLAAADAGLHCLADVELFKTGVSPNKLYDYMAAGLPVITNTGGDTASMVERAGSGFAVAPDDIASGIQRLAALDDAERAALGWAGRAFMHAERSRTAMAHRLEAALDELV